MPISRKRSLGSFFRRFSTGSGTARKVGPSPYSKKKGVYGVPLCESICYARSTVGYVDEDSIKHRRAGIIPLVVAKCGSFLKAHGLQTEGVFRISGNNKRVNELQALFNDPRESYGLNLNWLGYTVHDAATALRRYLNKLPEPVIPHNFYKEFRNVMSDKHYHSIEERIQAFQHLIQHLPIPHQHLLLYLLDLLSLFASNSVETKMDAANLAIVFAPGILSHPQHHSPVQYRISQRVLEFLIEFQALFTMQLLSQKNSSKRLKRAPPVPPIPNNLAAPRATKSDPLLPLSPQPIRLIPPELLSQADLPLDEKHQVTPPPSQTPDEEDVPTPRATSPVAARSFIDSPPQSPPLSANTPQLQEEEQENLLHALRRIYGDIRRMLPWQEKPVVYLAWIGVVNVVVMVLMYELYQAIWGMCCFEPYIFFTGFIFYWALLARGITWTGQGEPHYESYRGGWLGGVPDQDDDDDEDDGLSLFDDISIMEQDEEEARMRNSSCEWHSLLTRSWRTDDEYGQTKDPDMVSIMSASSRFNEEAAAAHDDYDDESSSSLPDLDALLSRHQQLVQNNQEKTPMRQRSQSSNGGREEWKFSTKTPKF